MGHLVKEVHVRQERLSYKNPRMLRAHDKALLHWMMCPPPSTHTHT